MKKSFSFLSLVLLLLIIWCGGCSTTQYSWSNPRKTENQFYQDRARCQAMANSVGSTQVIPAYGTGVASMTLNTLNLIDSIDADKARRQIFSDCMMGEGWRLVEKTKTEDVMYKEKNFPEKRAALLMHIEMVLVKGGCYQMGDIFGDGYPDEKPVHEVCVNDFYLGKYEVTQGLWEAIVGNNPSYYKSGDNYPVENVSWNDVQEFIVKLNQKTGKKYRLPTEAEWEYAARSGGKEEKWAGTSNESKIGDFAWYESNSGGKTHPVGEKKSNGLGLYDMSGNVWEWCQDTFSKYAYGQHSHNNPIYTAGSSRVVRGGAWNSVPSHGRSASRYNYLPSFRYSIGFRLAE